MNVVCKLYLKCKVSKTIGTDEKNSQQRNRRYKEEPNEIL
jgi:hypothetical protein